MRSRLLFAVAAGLLTLAAFPAARAATHDVDVANFAFDPTPLQADPNDQIVWTWRQGTHNVTAWAGAAFSSPSQTTGTFQATFPGGVVRYRCTLHSALVNNGTECSGMCAVIAEDTTPPPAPSIQHPGANDTVRSPVAVSGTSSNAETITVKEGTTVLGEAHAESNGAWSVTLTLQTGSHTLRAYARNIFGIDSGPSAPVTFVVDATPPAVAITSPGDPSAHPGAVVVEGNASDVEGDVASVVVTFTPLLPGSPIMAATACTGCGTPSATFTATADPPPGLWQITATATDAAGNARTSAPVTILTG